MTLRLLLLMEFVFLLAVPAHAVPLQAMDKPVQISFEKKKPEKETKHLPLTFPLQKPGKRLGHDKDGDGIDDHSHTRGNGHIPAIPEPEPLWMAMLGLVGLAVLGRRIRE